MASSNMASINTIKLLLFIVFVSLVSCEDSPKKLELEDVIEELMSLKRTIIHQKKRIDQLERKSVMQDGIVLGLRKRIQNLESKGEALSSKMERSDKGLKSETSKHNKSDIDKGEHQNFRKERLLLTAPPANTDSVAFFAYMSQSDSNPGLHHTLIFDVVKTNIGNAYHKFSGTFIVPQSGIYVFFWTIRQNPSSVHSTEILVNDNVVTSVYQLTSVSTTNTASGIVVVNVSQGDDVFVRTHPSLQGKREIYSNIHGRSAFGGWRIN